MNKILRHLENEKIVKEVKDVKALMIGSDSMRFKVCICFSLFSLLSIFFINLDLFLEKNSISHPPPQQKTKTKTNNNKKAEIHFHGSVLAERYLQQHVDSEALLSSLETTEQLDAFLIEYGAGLVEYIGIFCFYFCLFICIDSLPPFFFFFFFFPGDEVDRLEENLKKQNPNIHHIDLEVD